MWFMTFWIPAHLEVTPFGDKSESLEIALRQRKDSSQPIDEVSYKIQAMAIPSIFVLCVKLKATPHDTIR